ncbi:hypothetical protein [Streptomyces sp. NPDC058385]|uniref:hypothetical protein n=1 Tax=Streptomyces sp. NPDC058385 TaxID=3346473 RepID=UPI0036570ACE
MVLHLSSGVHDPIGPAASGPVLVAFLVFIGLALLWVFTLATHVPQGAEQFMNADKLVELGVARRAHSAEATTEGWPDRCESTLSQLAELGTVLVDALRDDLAWVCPADHGRCQV